MKTLISHFFNEEYLLPWWLDHHRRVFDHGILIDYDSTDNSVNIIKQLCPNWEIRRSNERDFSAYGLDKQINAINDEVEGWRTTLCTTEFLIGDFDQLTQDQEKTDLHVGCAIMVDKEPDKTPSYDHLLITQKHFGTSPFGDYSRKTRGFRGIYNYSSPNRPDRIVTGRHVTKMNTRNFFIIWYAWSPWTPEFVARKRQIGTKQAQFDIDRRLGFQHQYGDTEHQQEIKKALAHASDLSTLISRNLNYFTNRAAT